MRSMIALISICALSMLLVNCSDDDKEKGRGSIRQIFVKGDPMELIKGATTDPTIQSTRQDIESLTGYYGDGLVAFSEKEEKENKDSSQSAIENENAPGSQDESAPKAQGAAGTKNGPMAITKVNAETYSFSGYISRALKIDIALKFKEGFVTPTSVTIGNVTVPVKLIHFSQTMDQRQFSLLLSMNLPVEGKTLVSLVFSKAVSQQSKQILSKVYQYLFGPGVKVRWNKNQTRTLFVCGETSKKDTKIIGKAVTDWAQALGGRLTFNAMIADRYPPFSDLNAQCIYTSDLYLSDPVNVNPGVTTPISDLETGLLVDADIFIFRNELKVVNADSETNRARTILHEIGHLLGLHHQFDGTKSIMSYQNETELHDYDIKAIQELYN